MSIPIMPDTTTARYRAAAHRIQTAIALLHSKRPLKRLEPKHMRVGIDVGKAEFAGLVDLLISVGVITMAQFEEAMAKSVEMEAERYRLEVQEAVDPSGQTVIHLG